MGAGRGRVGFFVGGDGKRREIGRIDDHWRVRQGGGNWFDYIEFGLDDGFVREFAAAGFEALEFLGGAAVGSHFILRLTVGLSKMVPVEGVWAGRVVEVFVLAIGLGLQDAVTAPVPDHLR